MCYRSKRNHPPSPSVLPRPQILAHQQLIVASLMWSACFFYLSAPTAQPYSTTIICVTKLSPEEAMDSVIGLRKICVRGASPADTGFCFLHVKRVLLFFLRRPHPISRPRPNPFRWPSTFVMQESSIWLRNKAIHGASPADNWFCFHVWSVCSSILSPPRPSPAGEGVGRMGGRGLSSALLLYICFYRYDNILTRRDPN